MDIGHLPSTIHVQVHHQMGEGNPDFTHDAQYRCRIEQNELHQDYPWTCSKLVTHYMGDNVHNYTHDPRHPCPMDEIKLHGTSSSSDSSVCSSTMTASLKSSTSTPSTCSGCDSPSQVLEQIHPSISHLTSYVHPNLETRITPIHEVTQLVNPLTF